MLGLRLTGVTADNLKFRTFPPFILSTPLHLGINGKVSSSDEHFLFGFVFFHSGIKKSKHYKSFLLKVKLLIYSYSTEMKTKTFERWMYKAALGVY